MHGILAFSGVIMSTTRPLSFLRQSVLSLPKGILWFDVRKKQKQKRSGRLFKWVLFLIVNRYCHFPCHMHLPRKKKKKDKKKKKRHTPDATPTGGLDPG